MSQPRSLKISQRALVLLGVVFGAVTIFASFRVLAGVNPSYEVFTPLLVYNLLMGFVYIAVGVVGWFSLERGKQGALAILVLNLLVLVAVVVVYRLNAGIAVESLAAMALRTFVWLVIFAGLWWLSRVRTSQIRDL
ncbi:MAG: hypothetical protein IBX50_06725 [Marinospirillum sp.]|uniref:hypothetical protein n=1 Tax=Marinospirillum sp. TaxID=2183934 RepID=UPI0019EF5505|nr:hypothetical protein [Marinospirillum sp.]MBE0506402.1 hypothetical protein [Marinospirillum sp.]